MSCCKSPYPLGCLDRCSIIETTILFTQTGIHTFYFSGVNKFKTEISGVVGENIILDLNKLNGNSCYNLRIVNPNGVPFIFTVDDIIYDCISFKTEFSKMI